jgi:hypothetical protein
VNSTVATSAIPIGIPGWPEAALSTASAERKRIAFAISASLAIGLLSIGSPSQFS